MVVKRIPVKPPKARRGGGVHDVSKGGWFKESERHRQAARGIETVPKKLPKKSSKIRDVSGASLQDFLFNQYRKEMWETTLLQLRKLAGKHVNDYGIGPVSEIDSVLVFGSFATMGKERPNDIDIAVFRKDRPSSEFVSSWDVPVTRSMGLDVFQASIEDKQQIMERWAEISRKTYGEAAFIDITRLVL